MLTKTSTIWYVDAPDPAAVLHSEQPDHDAAQALAGQLNPDSEVVPIASGNLADESGPEADQVFIGCYPGVTVVCSAQFALPKPAQLAEELIRPLASEQTYLIARDPRLGWGGFAHWERGMLRRSFSATRVNILENEGLPVVWELPFWAGEYPMTLTDPQRLPFDPLQFSDAAGRQWLGFGYDRPESQTTPKAIAVSGFALYPSGQAPQPASERNSAKRSLRKWLKRKSPVSP